MASFDLSTNKDITYFAETDFRGKKTPFGIKTIDRARHFYVIGKTGMGKSTLLENMAIQDIRHGNGFGYLDPHGSTAEKLLEFVPPERVKDVLYFAPFDLEHPVSFNIMEDVGRDKRHLVANGLLASFKKIWPDVWSSRMEYILNNTILALLEYPDSTLLGVNRMLSDKNYRKKVVDNISDPSVKSFWVDEFAKYNERYMQEAGDAIKNKIGQFTSNPLIRNIIGQPKSSFDVRQLMDEKKILIVNLSKGRVGEQNANLLGGMLITKIYLAAMSRADLSETEMRQVPPFFLFVDEFQSFVNESFKDILAEARKYKLNLTIAHQYIDQMPEEVRSAVFGNVGTTVSFRVGPFDAEVLEKVFAPKFTQEDLVNLGFVQIYLTLMIDGVGSPPFSAVTLPPLASDQVSHKDAIIEASRAQFSKTRSEVETAINQWHEMQAQAAAASEPDFPSRRPTFGNHQKTNPPSKIVIPTEIQTAIVAAQKPEASAPATPKPVVKTEAKRPETQLHLSAAPNNPPVEPVAPISKPSPFKPQQKVPLSALVPSKKHFGGTANKNQLRQVLADVLGKTNQSSSASPDKTSSEKIPPVTTSSVKKEVPEDVLRKMLET